LRQGSASIAFAKVTRKTGGEWLRVKLATPMQLADVKIAVLDAAVKIHEVVAHTQNQQAFTLPDLSETGTFYVGDSRKGDLSIYPDRITVLDIRAEAMGAVATLNITVKSVEGTPKLSTQRFPSVQ
jgi:hypothetical protein